jgi:hypothetical protein
MIADASDSVIQFDIRISARQSMPECPPSDWTGATYLPARGLRQFLVRLARENCAGDIGFITSVASTATINSEKLCPPAVAIR